MKWLHRRKPAGQPEVSIFDTSWMSWYMKRLLNYYIDFLRKEGFGRYKHEGEGVRFCRRVGGQVIKVEYYNLSDYLLENLKNPFYLKMFVKYYIYMAFAPYYSALPFIAEESELSHED